ncbi:helix-turn-helix domain-containing protein [Streptomyces misionensis]|uniref:Helix-turn-helix domain-containing protein n=1 Tax=Streptomyces misionensis TaxID=67331 RepID=A0A5C6K5V6_9ACTN|nr:helix-turn-helix domain-containing protein [Streptomyces misionensis]TWV57771.1 helix-turn-helix domain-containing protein [Streptomyces misionensis]
MSLRHEELARLAGIGTDYDIRPEQGHSGNVSEEILHALAKAPRLDRTERAHMTNLAAAGTGPRRRSPERPQRVRPGLHGLVGPVRLLRQPLVSRRRGLTPATGCSG